MRPTRQIQEPSSPQPWSFLQFGDPPLIAGGLAGEAHPPRPLLRRRRADGMRNSRRTRRAASGILVLRQASRRPFHLRTESTSCWTRTLPPAFASAARAAHSERCPALIRRTGPVGASAPSKHRGLSTPARAKFTRVRTHFSQRPQLRSSSSPCQHTRRWSTPGHWARSRTLSVRLAPAPS